MRVSQKFVAAVKLSGQREYQLARKAKIHPSTLSGLINGIQEPKPMDPRVVSVAKILGLDPEEAFEDEKAGK